MRRFGFIIIMSLMLAACVNTLPIGKLQQRLPNWQIQSSIAALVIGDMGDGSDRQQQVAAAMLQQCQQQACDFVLTVGDNIYPDGLASLDNPLIQSNFEQPYQAFDIPFFITLGNHDWRGLFAGIQASIDYSLVSDKWTLPANHYAVPNLPDWLSVYVLDTVMIESVVKKKQVIKAAKDFLCGKSGWRVLLGHHPLRSNEDRGSGVNRIIQRSVESLIDECDVHIYFSGHSHHQEHIDMTFYQHVIQGAGGTTPRRIKRVGGQQKFVAAENGFSYLAIDQQHFLVQFYNANGQLLHEFRLVADD